MPTSALATFGVYCTPSGDELAILDLADQFRREYCAIMQERHERTINIRNDRFPELFAALCESERLYFAIGRLELEIKAHHSEVRDRNAVTPAQQAELAALRERRKQQLEAVKAGRAKWSDYLKRFRACLKASADSDTRKAIKTLEKRRELYESLEWPEEFADYAAMWLDTDLRMRELGREYQDLGLHSSIRAEIVDASQQKLGKDKPGIRYRYGRKPEPRPWTKLTLQIPGGLSWDEALAGTSALSVEPLYTNHLPDGPETVYRVRQQIGTKDHPAVAEYTTKLHREVPPGARIQRWTLVVRGRRRSCIPIFADLPDTAQGSDCDGENSSLAYRLSWTRCKGGLLVATFMSRHVNERLILPEWLVVNRMAVADEQARCDLEANEWLARQGAVPQPGKRQGMAALEAWIEDRNNPAGANVLHSLACRMARARKTASKAAGCIEKIYETVAARMARLHDSVVIPKVDLKQMKRYDTRDLLQEDKVPRKSREYMHAAAPGKLHALLKRRLPPASDEVADEIQAPSRSTDVFTSWVKSLAVKTGTKPNRPNRRSQHDTLEVAG